MKLCHQRDFESEVLGNGLCPERVSRSQPHFIFGDPRHCLARASLVPLRAGEGRKQRNHPAPAHGGQQQGMSGKPPGASPKTPPKPHQHQKPRIPTAHWGEETHPGHPQVTAIPPAENITLLAKCLFEVPGEQPGCLQQPMPPQAPPLARRIPNWAARSSCCCPSNAYLHTSEAAAPQGQFCPLHGTIL